MFVDELPLNGKLSVFVTGAADAGAAASSTAPTRDANATPSRPFMTFPHFLEDLEPREDLRLVREATKREG